MTGRPHCHASALDRLHSGFSLLELILVLTVIVMASAVVGPRLLPRVSESGLKSVAWQFKSDLADMRAAAVESGVPMGCLVWHQRSEYVLGSASELLRAASVSGSAADTLDTDTTPSSATVPSNATPVDAATSRLPATAPRQPSGPAIAVVPAMRTVSLPSGLVVVPVVSAPSGAGTDIGTDQQWTGETTVTGSAGSTTVLTEELKSGRSRRLLQPSHPQSSVPRAVDSSVHPGMPESRGAVAVEWSLIVFQPSGRSHNLQFALYDSNAGKWLGLQLRGLTGALTLSSVQRLDPRARVQRGSSASSSSHPQMPTTSRPNRPNSAELW